jgi:hypothetical protein
MRRLFRVVLAGAMILLPALSLDAQAQDKTTFNGEIALWSFGIKPDQTAGYEKVIAKLKEALMKSSMPEAKQMAAGWKVMRGVVNPQTGNVIYTHVIYPVVPNADYTITKIIYDVFTDPTEQKAIYDLYRGAFGAALGANVGTVVADLSK